MSRPAHDYCAEALKNEKIATTTTKDLGFIIKRNQNEKPVAVEQDGSVAFRWNNVVEKPLTSYDRKSGIDQSHGAYQNLAVRIGCDVPNLWMKT